MIFKCEGKAVVLAGPSHTVMVFCLGVPFPQFADADIPFLSVNLEPNETFIAP
jgi:hypothetical protein